MSIFNGLGRALRWLRDRRGKRQYQIADSAGITKAMLSAYETGKQKPSLDTLEKILAALDCDLNDLHNALQIVNERPEAIRRSLTKDVAWSGFPRDARGVLPGGEGSLEVDLYRILGINQPLPPQEEQALSEMLGGFHKLLRYFHGTVSQPSGDEEPSDDQA